ncbi:MAG: M16 family metallopeptidase [Syntrophomonadaceae bacterium]|jgi:predicted Zn-dependent peptidase
MINCWDLNCRAKLAIEEIPYIKSAVIGVYIKLGSRHENDRLRGASHFIEHMLFKGTQTRTAREIAEIFEGIGGQLNAFTSKEYTCIYARTLDENLPLAIEIIFDMLFNSSFALKEFDTEKKVIIEEINMHEDSPDVLIHDIFAQNLWQGHSMGFPILGNLESVTSFNRNELYDFYKKMYLPGNMVISIAGNVDADQIRAIIERCLEGQPVESARIPQQPPSNYQPFISMVDKDTEQIQICLGTIGTSYWDENRHIQNVMNSILGGGMSSRLFQTIREELGLAYSIYSSPSLYSDTGSFTIYAGTGPANVSGLFKALYNEISGFVSQGISLKELLRTKQLLKSSMYLGLESAMNRMSRIGRSVMMYGEIIPAEAVIDKIQAIKPEMIKELAEALLSRQQFSLAAIGPKEALKTVEEEFVRWWR